MKTIHNHHPHDMDSYFRSPTTTGPSVATIGSILGGGVDSDAFHFPRQLTTVIKGSLLRTCNRSMQSPPWHSRPTSPLSFRPKRFDASSHLLQLARPHGIAGAVPILFSLFVWVWLFGTPYSDYICILYREYLDAHPFLYLCSTAIVIPSFECDLSFIPRSTFLLPFFHSRSSFLFLVDNIYNPSFSLSCGITFRKFCYHKLNRSFRRGECRRCRDIPCWQGG